ncbi:MAG TPA: SRPBCC family protein [Isosphaeraceae bacterium]|jgi:uncharacterized membrane protein|nr:SRPBCC family protein [Isosphaeraceae bacterium]
MTTLHAVDSVGRRVRERDEDEGFASAANVGTAERVATGALGAALALGGLRRGTPGGWLAASLGGALAVRAATGYCPVYGAMGVAPAGKARADRATTFRGVKVRSTFTINRPAQECYDFWRNFENLPRFMTHLKSVTVLDGRRSHWEAEGPLNQLVGWDAEILEDKPGELISWKTIGLADVHNAGSVRFRPASGNRGTEVVAEVSYEPPAGSVGVALAKLTGADPKHLIREDLRRFKQLVEAGEVATITGQSHCRR